MKEKDMKMTPENMALNLCATLQANVDNAKLTDAEFRQFVRNSLPLVLPEKPNK